MDRLAPWYSRRCRPIHNTVPFEGGVICLEIQTHLQEKNMLPD